MVASGTRSTSPRSVAGGGSAGGALRSDVASFQPAKACLEDLQRFAQGSFEEAQDVIKSRMPAKIIEITRILSDRNEYRDYFAERVALCGIDSGERFTDRAGLRSARPDRNGSPLFVLVQKETALLKEQVLQLVEMACTVKLWLQLNVPRIEDGNNFGVGIQTDTIGELARVEDAALVTIENWSKYLLMRAKVIGKMDKHSHKAHHHHHDGQQVGGVAGAPRQAGGEEALCEGAESLAMQVERAYEMALEAIDEKQVRSIWIGWLDLRNNYAILYDVLVKNLDKLLNPRTSNTSNMY